LTLKWLAAPAGSPALLAVAALTIGLLVCVKLIRRPGESHKRGAVLVQARRQARVRPASAGADSLTLGGVRVPFLDETKHFKMIGTTGTGKSTAIRELLAGALARGDRAVFADPDGGYRKRFFLRGRGDVTLNPFEPDSVKWDPFERSMTPMMPNSWRPG
jgi:hypothetical protein